MNKIKEKIINIKLKNWTKDKILLTKLQQIKEEKSNILKKEEKKKLTTTKLLTFFLLLNCTIIQFFTLYIILKQLNMGMEVDLTPLQMLITTIVGQVIVFIIYSIKSLKENTKGGIVYDMALNEQENFIDQNIQEAEG